MDASIHKSRLDEGLEALETALESPLVPGELQTWLENAAAAFAKLEAPLRGRIEEDHPRWFDEISHEDEGLLERVKHLREKDRELLAQYERLARQANSIDFKLEEDHETETRLDPIVERLSEHGLEFVIAVRKQEAAVTTWFVEAFQRDRGVAD